MHWKIREPNPDRDCNWDIHGRIEVRGPFVEVEALRSHEIGSIPEDQVFFLLCVELEQEEASTQKIRGDFAFDQRNPVLNDPVFHRFWRGPKARELTHQGTICQGQSDLDWALRREVYLWNIVEPFDELSDFGLLLSGSEESREEKVASASGDGACEGPMGEPWSSMEKKLKSTKPICTKQIQEARHLKTGMKKKRIRSDPAGRIS